MRRIRGNAEERPPNVTQTPSAAAAGLQQQSCGHFRNYKDLLKTTIMENKRKPIVSIRLDERYIRAIDKWLEGHPYFTRSSVINNVLGAVLAGTNPATFFDIVSVDVENEQPYQIQIVYKP